MGTGNSLTDVQDPAYNSFLSWIVAEGRHERFNFYSRYSAYYNGDHDVNLPPKIKAALAQELAVVSNMCKPVVDLTVQFLVGEPVSIDVTQDGRNTEISEWGEMLLYRVYKRNRLLYANMIRLLRSMGKKGDSFLKFYVQNDDMRVAVLRPESVFPKYLDDNYEDMELCAIKHFTLDADGNRIWRAQVFHPDRVEYYYLGLESRELNKPKRLWNRLLRRNRGGVAGDDADPYFSNYNTQQFDKWEIEGVQENPMGMIPIVHLKNNIDDMPWGVSDLQGMISLQDNLNKSLTDMMVSLDNTAFPRMFILNSLGSGEISVSPGTHVELSGGEQVQVIPPGSINSYAFGIQQLVKQMASVSQIPVEAFDGFNGIPVSGYALRILFMNLESKTKERMANVKDGLSQLNRMIFRAAALMGLAPEETLATLETDTHFTTGIPVDKLADTQYYLGLLNGRVISRDWVRERVGVQNLDEMRFQVQGDLYEDYGVQLDIAEATAEEE